MSDSGRKHALSAANYSECPSGYTEADLKRILGDQREEFGRWMVGQTISSCPCPGAPHGGITFAADLQQFIRGGGAVD